MSVKNNLTSLTSLSNSEAWKKEVGMMQAIVLKITIRLRCARVTVILNQIMKRIHAYKRMHVLQSISPTTTLIFK